MKASPRFSRLAVNLSPPPPYADEQEAPVVKELRLFAFEPVADELQRPSRNEKHKRVKPQTVKEDACDEQGERNQNCRYPESVAHPVYRVLMATGILRDPFFVSAPAQHGDFMIHGPKRKVAVPR